jgi:succinyl-diaminopimelate desuccinylase
MLDELKTLINFHPTTNNQHTVSAVLDHIQSRLVSNGLIVERITHSGVHSLYASTRGQKHAKVMLQGHIDVVPGGEDFRIDGDTIYGRGSFDMLFGIASFLAYIDQLENPADYDLSVLLTGDEEAGGRHGVYDILNTEKYTCDVCVLPDGGDHLGAMCIASKGINHFRLHIAGKSHHGSRPWEGDGAGNKAVNLLSEVNQLFDLTDPYNSTFTVSQLQAGNTALNQGPNEAHVGMDIRYKDEDDAQRIRQELHDIFKKYDASVVFEERGHSFALDTKTPLIQQFVDMYSHHLGRPVEFMKSHGSSDARHFGAKGMPVIMFRPDGGNAHGDGEWLSYSSWQKFHDILTDYVDTTAKQ